MEGFRYLVCIMFKISSLILLMADPNTATIYEKNVLEIRNELTLRLVNFLKPHIYDGIDNIYEHSDKMFNKLIKLHELSKDKADIPSKSYVFHNLLSIAKN